MQLIHQTTGREQQPQRRAQPASSFYIIHYCILCTYMYVQYCIVWTLYCVLCIYSTYCTTTVQYDMQRNSRNARTRWSLQCFNLRTVYSITWYCGTSAVQYVYSVATTIYQQYTVSCTVYAGVNVLILIVVYSYSTPGTQYLQALTLSHIGS